MFTGIIETTGRIDRVRDQGSNRTFWISSPLSPELRIDQSLSHDGVCLTIEAISDGLHQVTAIRETLKKTNLGEWKTGDLVNLERAMLVNSRLDGHFVQGHADTTAICKDIVDQDGSWLFRFGFGSKFSALIIEKGSVAVNGISLTAFEVTKKAFSVAIIPYTFEHSNIRFIKKGSSVNIEFDMIGKYVARFREVDHHSSS